MITRHEQILLSWARDSAQGTHSLLTRLSSDAAYRAIRLKVDALRISASVRCR